MTVVTQAQKLQVDATRLLDGRLVGEAFGFSVGIRAVGHMSLCLVDVNMVEEVRVHEVAVALVMVAWKSAVLVQVEGSHVFEADLARCAILHKLGIQPDGSGACPCSWCI